MQFNVHTPERQPHETQKQYRERQALSKASAQPLRLVHDSGKFGTYFVRQGLRT